MGGDGIGSSMGGNDGVGVIGGASGPGSTTGGGGPIEISDGDPVGKRSHNPFNASEILGGLLRGSMGSNIAGELPTVIPDGDPMGSNRSHSPINRGAPLDIPWPHSSQIDAPFPFPFPGIV